MLDKGSIELIGPAGFEKLLLKCSKSLTSLNTTVIPNYALGILVSLMLFILIVFFGIVLYIFFIYLTIFCKLNIKLFFSPIIAQLALW